MSRVTLPLNVLIELVDHVRDEYGDIVPLELFDVSISEFEDHFIVSVGLQRDGDGIRPKTSFSV